jgi:hypothetical protein
MADEDLHVTPFGLFVYHTLTSFRRSEGVQTFTTVTPTARQRWLSEADSRETYVHDEKSIAFPNHI